MKHKSCLSLYFFLEISSASASAAFLALRNTNMSLSAFYCIFSAGLIKGTVRPDWISLRVISLDRPQGHQPLCLWFFNFVLEYLRRDKCSEPLHTKMHLILQLVGNTGYLEVFLPIGWRTFIWWKNPPKLSSILVWIAEWWNSLHTSCNPKNNCWISRFFGARFGRKIAVCAHTTCDPNK